MQTLRSLLEIPESMIDQERTRFLSEIEGGMLIWSKAGAGDTEKSRYEDGSGSAGTFDRGETFAERGEFWGPDGNR